MSDEPSHESPPTPRPPTATVPRIANETISELWERASRTRFYNRSPYDPAIVEMDGKSLGVIPLKGCKTGDFVIMLWDGQRRPTSYVARGRTIENMTPELAKDVLANKYTMK